MAILLITTAIALSYRVSRAGVISYDDIVTYAYRIYSALSNARRPEMIDPRPQAADYLAQIEAIIGDTTRANKTLGELLSDIRRTAPPHYVAAEALTAIAVAQYHLGHLNEAATTLTKAEQEARKIEEDKGIETGSFSAGRLGDIAAAKWTIGDRSGSKAAFRSLVDSLNSKRDKYTGFAITEYMSRLAVKIADTGDFEFARTIALSEVPIAQTYRSGRVANALSCVAQVELRAGNTDAAVMNIDKAIDVMKQQPPLDEGEAYIHAFVAEDIVAMCLKLERYEIAERAAKCIYVHSIREKVGEDIAKRRRGEDDESRVNALAAKAPPIDDDTLRRQLDALSSDMKKLEALLKVSQRMASEKATKP